jgi:hypothetical protein
MHMNRIKCSLLTHLKDWAWGSFFSYSKTGHGLNRMDSVN